MSNTEVILVIVGQTKPQATPKTGNGTDQGAHFRFQDVIGVNDVAKGA